MTRLNVKPVASGKYHHSYDPQSILSIDFGQLVPSLKIDTVLGDDWNKVHGSSIMRIAPQVFPPYGRAYLKSAAFFVPEHQLMESSEGFHSNQSTWKGKSVLRPTFSSTTICLYFATFAGLSTNIYDSTNPVTDSSLPSLNAFDFVYVTDSSGAPVFHYRKLTRLGCYYYKILKGLGYDFPSFVYHSTYSDTLASGSFPCDALPLLAYAKIYCDMFMNGQYYNRSSLVAFLQAVHDSSDYLDSNGNTCYYSSLAQFSAYAFSLIFGTILLPHSQNLYTEAWNEPNAPLTSLGSDMSVSPGNNSSLLSPYMQNDSQIKEHIGAGVNGTAYDNSEGTIYTMTANGQRMLLAFDKFVKRFGLFGSKAVQRVYAAFGIKPDDMNAHFVHKLYEGQSRIQFHPVMSNAQTVYNAQVVHNVGDFAGYGVASMDVDFNYKSKDYGYVIVLHWIQVTPLMLRGFNPSNLKIKPFDFYTPELDGKAIRAIPLCEVGTVRKSNMSNLYSNSDKDIYGFCNLYDEMRHMRDTIIGDFVVGSPSNRNFLFCRDYSVLRESGFGMPKPQLSSVQYFDQADNADMSDPFIQKSASGDRFWIAIDWDIEAQRPVVSDEVAFDFTGSGDMSLNKNGVLIN